MNWGHGVMSAFILFAGYIIALVTGCFQQNIDLVAEDYYAQEVVYQSRIDDINNAKPFADQIVISQNQAGVSIQFPAGLANLINNGSIQFFRPSDASMDIMLNLDQLVDGQLILPMAKFTGGRYEVHIQWDVQDQGYFLKKDLFI
jgi:hypothetical protein